MKYAILTNPVTGSLSVGEKYQQLGPVADILGPDCFIYGLDAASPAAFRVLARRLAERAEVLVVAGGDGTLNEVVNAVPKGSALAYLPLGSGNALKYALKLPLTLSGVARRIKRRKARRVDLISCNGQKALFASIGLEGRVLVEREKFVRDGIKGFESYLRAAVDSVFGGKLKAGDGEARFDGERLPLRSVYSLIVTKIKNYGYGIMVLPQAKLDDGRLHVLIVSSEIWDREYGFAAPLVGGSQEGAYRVCKELSFISHRTLPLQLNGSLAGKGKEFKFKVLKGALRLVY